MMSAADAPIRVRDVPARSGAAWLAAGWQLFRRKPWAWIGLAAGWMVITLGLVMVPLIGGVVANLLQPVFFASFALAAHRQRGGQSIDMGSLFAGFRRPLRPLINVGALLLAAELLVFVAMGALGLPGLTPGEKGAVFDMRAWVEALQGKEWILVVGALLTGLVKGALWFTPALLAFHDLTTAHALRWSVYAALSNLGAMLVYGVVLTALFVAGALPWGLGLLVAIPVMVASTYTGFADVFGEPPSPAQGDSPP